MKSALVWIRNHRLLAVFVTLNLLVLCALLAFFVAKPWFKNRQVHQALQKSRDFLEQNKLKEAYLEAAQAYLIQPSHEETLILLMQIAAKGRSPDLLRWARELVQASPTPTNHLQLASISLSVEKAPWSNAVYALEHFNGNTNANAPFHLLSGVLAGRTNNLVDAEWHWNRALELDPTNLVYQFRLASLQMYSTNETKRAEARSVFQNLRSNEKVEVGALRALVVDSLRNNDLDQALELADALSGATDGGFWEELLKLGLLQAKDPGKAGEKLQEMWKMAQNEPSKLYYLASWMRTKKMETQLLEWMDQLPEDIRLSPQISLILSQVLYDQQKYDEVVALLQRVEWKSMDYLRWAIGSRCLHQGGDTSKSQQFWNQGVKAAQNDVRSLTRLSEIAFQWRWFDRLTIVLEQLPPNRVSDEILDPAAQFFFSEGNTLSLQKILQIKYLKDPKDSVDANNFAMTSLLLDMNIDESAKIAYELFRQAPSDPSIASTYALALWKKGLINQAIAIIEPFCGNEGDNQHVCLYLRFFRLQAGELSTMNQSIGSDIRLLPEERLLFKL